jgi:hypothetical protein
MPARRRPAPDRPHHARPDALALAEPGAAPLDAPALARLWHELGGRLGGRAREGDLSGGRPDHARLPLLGADGDPLPPLATLLSPPLPEVVHEINKTSDNVAARHLMLSLSRGFPAQAATLAGARERLQQWLQRQGLGRGDIELDNGSGLSRAERSRPRALVQLLRSAWADADLRTFVDSLPVAGVDGTLAHRLQGGAAAGQAFLKTGSLAGHARTGRLCAVAQRPRACGGGVRQPRQRGCRHAGHRCGDRAAGASRLTVRDGPVCGLECAAHCGCSSMVERQLPKLHTRVRFPSPAPRPARRPTRPATCPGC